MKWCPYCEALEEYSPIAQAWRVADAKLHQDKSVDLVLPGTDTVPERLRKTEEEGDQTELFEDKEEEVAV